jgi:hypothetical protein
VPDGFFDGFKRLIGFAAYGFKSIIEFMPGLAGRVLRFVASLLPRPPKALSVRSSFWGS